MDDFCMNAVGLDRGRIAEKKTGPLYRVESYTRGGILSRWIEAAQGEYAVNDNVYFFTFDDGRGLILGRMID